MSFIPILNLLPLGYLVRYTRQVGQGNINLPEWDDWAGLVREGVTFFLIGLGWMGLPALVGLSLTLVLKGLFSVLLMGFLAATVAWAPFVICCVLGYLLSLLALLRYLQTEELREAFEVAMVLRAATRRLDTALVPSLAVLGLWTIGWPLYGITFFVGTLLLLAYLVLTPEA